jgi:hypothetical protein
MSRFTWQVSIAVLALGWLALAGASSAAAQTPVGAGTVGLSASVQDGQQGIALPIWVTEKFVLAPAVNVTHVGDVGTDLGIGALFRGNLRAGRAVPYLGLRVLVFMLSPEVGDSATDLVVGPTLGGEYFLGEALSLSVEAQLNIAKSDENSLRFGQPDATTINTATAVLATFYF